MVKSSLIVSTLGDALSDTKHEGSLDAGDLIVLQLLSYFSNILMENFEIGSTFIRLVHIMGISVCFLA
jgi:hypothetical protein